MTPDDRVRAARSLSWLLGVAATTLTMIACRGRAASGAVTVDEMSSHATSQDRLWGTSGPAIVGNGLGAPDTLRVAARPSMQVGEDGTLLLFHVTGVSALSTGAVVIANSGSCELIYLTSSGRILHRVGDKGGGPGEFEDISWIGVRGGDSIMAFDAAQRRLSVFDASGRFVRDVYLSSPDGPLDPYPIGMARNGRILATEGAVKLAAQGPTRVERGALPIYVYDRDGARSRLVRTVPGLEIAVAPTGGRRPNGVPVVGRSPRMFGVGTALAMIQDRIVAADNATFSLAEYELSGKVAVRFRRAFDLVRVTRDDVDSARAERLAAIASPSRRRAVARAWRDRPSAPRFFPAFDGSHLVIEHGHRIWVGSYPVPGTTRQRWWGFSIDGALVDEFDVPARLRVTDIGPDYVLGIWRTHDDVETVRMYRFDRSAAATTPDLARASRRASGAAKNMR